MSAIIKTYSDEIYIIPGKTPEEVWNSIAVQEVVLMPNGDVVKKAHIATIQSRESYRFQADQKHRHKQGQYLRSGSWYDAQGEVARADLSSVTGELKLPAGQDNPRLENGNR